MKQEAQKIAIAEACGWKDIHTYKDSGYYHGCLMGDNGQRVLPLPDYLNDLNAMHEAEKVLKSRDEYVMRLREACGGFNPVFATAVQRAEAFLKTLGKWID